MSGRRDEDAARASSSYPEKGGGDGNDRSKPESSEFFDDVRRGCPRCIASDQKTSWIRVGHGDPLATRDKSVQMCMDMCRGMPTG
jgi:hypothetical protein